VKRIEDVVRLRSAQFVEDAGSMAHPIRPDSYIKMDNFYTLTVYEKGAEIVRLYQTLLGKEGFRYAIFHSLLMHYPHLSRYHSRRLQFLLMSGCPDAQERHGLVL